MNGYGHRTNVEPIHTARKWTHSVVGFLCGAGIFVTGCASTNQRVTPPLEAPPRLRAEEIAHQGEAVERPLAPDPIRFDLPPATLARLTSEVAADMGWREHFILQEEREGSYTVVLSEGSVLGVQRRVSITPNGHGAEVLVLPPDEGLTVRIREKVLTYLTHATPENRLVSPLVQRFSLPFSQVWRATKQTIIDGGFSFKTTDEEVGFIETERVVLGKARRSWFQGVGQLTRIARPPAVSYDYTNVEWRYRIRLIPRGTQSTEITVEAIVEAIPSASTLEQLTSGTLGLFSVPFGSWISSAAIGSNTSRLVLSSRGVLEKEFCAALAKKMPGAREKGNRSAKKRSRSS